MPDTVFGGHTTTATFTITPHCADGSVDTLSLRQNNSPGSTVWTAELKRMTTA